MISKQTKLERFLYAPIELNGFFVGIWKKALEIRQN